MKDNNFDHLILEFTKNLTEYFINNLKNHREFMEDVDTSSLLNLTTGVFVGSLVNLLDKIQENTIGEVKLFENIELAKKSILKAIEDLPFISKVEFIEKSKE